jgi:hypothetical protein
MTAIMKSTPLLFFWCLLLMGAFWERDIFMVALFDVLMMALSSLFFVCYYAGGYYRRGRLCRFGPRVALALSARGHTR